MDNTVQGDEHYRTLNTNQAVNKARLESRMAVRSCLVPRQLAAGVEGRRWSAGQCMRTLCSDCTDQSGDPVSLWFAIVPLLFSFSSLPKHATALKTGTLTE